MKIVFFWHSKNIRSKYWNNPDYIFFDNSGWKVFKNGLRQNISIDDFSQDPFKRKHNITKIVDEIRSYSEVWSRWYSLGDQNELLIREAVFQIYKIVSSLEKMGNGVGIFHTGVSHWFDVLICQISCKIAGWKQVFLYRDIFTSRLLPLIQQNDINDRKILGLKISNYKYENHITNFISNIKNKMPPEENALILNRDSSFLISVIYLQFNNFKKLIKWFFNKFNLKKNQRDIFSKYQKHYLFQPITSMVRQRKAIQFYNKKSYSLNSIKNKNKIKILIAAHFQPEATSFPEGAKFGNHIDIVIKLRNIGFEGEIYYKEHLGNFMYQQWNLGPTNVGMFRSVSYYKQLIELGCIFLDKNIHLDLNILKKLNFIPLTITGTIAIERSLNGFQTLITGQPWFKELPGLTHIDNLSLDEKFLKNMTNFDLNLATRSKNYFIKNLNYKTLSNDLDIGIIGNQKVKKEYSNFDDEFPKLLNLLKNLK